MVTGCEPSGKTIPEDISGKESGDYGRTPKEKLRDEQLMDEQFFQERELLTIAVLCDIILPSTSSFKSATEVSVPDFVEFIVKDLPAHQQPLRGGLMWLDHQCNTRFNRNFVDCNREQQMELIDEIAYPEPKNPQMKPGVTFFNRMRNLTLTGYYTTQEGVSSLGYAGNVPNVWDGVPESVLKEHGLTYDEAWESKCIDQSTRNIKAEWDENGNLLT